MSDIVIRTLPLIAIFAIGWGLRRLRVLPQSTGSILLRAVFYVAIPALVFHSLTSDSFEFNTFLIGLIVPAVITVTSLTLWIMRKSVIKPIPLKTFATISIGAVVMNTSFVLPFVENAFGTEGLSRIVVIDAINALFVFTIVYGIAAKFGGNHANGKFVIRRVLMSPPIWALIVGTLFHAANITPPALAADLTGLLAKTVSPLILLALGFNFTLHLTKIHLLIVPLMLRFLLGAIIGVCFIKISGIEGLDAQVVLLASIAPVGFNSVVFSEMERLDTRFASSQVSLSLGIGLILMPLAIFLLERIY